MTNFQLDDFECRFQDIPGCTKCGSPAVHRAKTNSAYQLQSRLCMFPGKRAACHGLKCLTGDSLVWYPSVTGGKPLFKLIVSPQEVTDKHQSSIWDWTPPGDLAETGTWKVLRELAGTLSKYAIQLKPNSHTHMHGHKVCMLTSILTHDTTSFLPHSEQHILVQVGCHRCTHVQMPAKVCARQITHKPLTKQTAYQCAVWLHDISAPAGMAGSQYQVAHYKS